MNQTFGRAETDADEAKRTRILASDVVQAIVRCIHREELRPGDRVREQEVADMLGTSRGPVREAFRMLEARGVLKVEAMRGATVARLSPQELVESVETAAVLFGLTARFAAERADARAKELIRARAVRLQALVNTPITPREFFIETVRVGQLVLAAADTAKLGDLLADQRMGWPNILGASGFTTKRLRARAADKWIRLASAIDTGNGRAARDLAEAVHHDVLAEAVKLGW